MRAAVTRKHLSKKVGEGVHAKAKQTEQNYHTVELCPGGYIGVEDLQNRNAAETKNAVFDHIHYEMTQPEGQNPHSAHYLLMLAFDDLFLDNKHNDTRGHEANPVRKHRRNQKSSYLRRAVHLFRSQRHRRIAHGQLEIVIARHLADDRLVHLVDTHASRLHSNRLNQTDILVALCSRVDLTEEHRSQVVIV